MKTVNIMIVGVGGQGTLLTSRVLGLLALQAGYDVKMSEVHGMAQRGGSVVTYVRFGEKVYEPVVEEGQADILLAFECLESARYAHFLKKDGILLLNDVKIEPMPVIIGAASYPEHIIEALSKKHKLIYADVEEEIKSLGNNKVFNTFLLGMLAKSLPFTKDEWLSVIGNVVPKKTIDVNQEAFLAGFRYVKKEVHS